MKFEFLSDRGSRKIVAIAVMIGIFIVGGVMAALFMLRQEAIDTHLKIAQLHARTFSDYFTQTVASIELTHREVSILKAAHSDLTTLRNMLERMPYVRSVSLLDDNDVVIDSTSQANIGKVVETKNFVPVPFMDETMLRFGPPYNGRDIADGIEIESHGKKSRLGFVPVVKSIKMGQKEYKLAITINSDYFINRYLQDLDSSIGFVDVVRMDGKLLFSTDEHAKIGAISQQFQTLFANGKDMGLGIQKYEGRDAMVAYRLSNAYPVAVVVRLDNDAALKQWERQRLNVLFVTALLVLISTALTLLLIIRQKKEQMMEEGMLRSKITAMSELVSMIAHQWRQPLTVVSAVLSNIKNAYDDGDLNEKYLKDSVKQGNDMLRYMSQTIDGFRNFFKPQQSKDVFCLCDSVVNALRLAFTGLQNSSIQIYFDGIEIKMPSDLSCREQMPIVGYKNEFLQVILSIIKNSKEAIEANNGKEKIIRIETKSDEHYYTASFYDNGGGIDKKLSQRIFEPYFTTKHDSMGVGMGLYVAKMLVEGGMGGTLSFDGVDGGVQFIIKFKKDDKNQKGIADV